ncbi:hypothetical protein E8E14_007018 [Neopestalotiopsis sp. 37M]|nr:hypothetical protein E8E14_007018 [Neopestalotiopsis sp. 37M]
MSLSSKKSSHHLEFDTTPFSSPANKTNNFHGSSPSSIYPSEGIRSEDCLSIQELASINRRGKDFILSDLSQYCYKSSEGRERMSELRSTSLTDGDGPHVRNLDTNLQEELLAADDMWCPRDVATSGEDADRSSEGSTADTSTGTMICSAGELTLTKQRAREEWNCVTADRVVLQCNFVNATRETSTSGIVCDGNGAAEDKVKSGHHRFEIRKWVRKTWGKTKHRLLSMEFHGKKEDGCRL